MNKCPSCGSENIWKFVTSDNIKKGKCEDCQHIFTLQDNKVITAKTK